MGSVGIVTEQTFACKFTTSGTCLSTQFSAIFSAYIHIELPSVRCGKPTANPIEASHAMTSEKASDFMSRYLLPTRLFWPRPLGFNIVFW
jgi:hypothetical protein